MDIHQILKYLPHRYPILLVDRVISYEAGKNIEALKNVSINEPFFSGHFPHYPVMPGVLIVEALAQAAALLTLKTENVGNRDDKSCYRARNQGVVEVFCARGGGWPIGYGSYAHVYGKRFVACHINIFA